MTQAASRYPRRMNSSRTFAAGLLLALAGAASGQNALGDGTGLANPLDVYQQQLRSESRTETFLRERRFRDAIVTGRAAGGLSFRGDLGYGSALEFRGELGSDVTYAFRRDSAISGLAAQGVSGTDALRFQFALTTGSAPPPGFAGSGVVPRSPSQVVLPSTAFVPRQSGSQFGMGVTGDFGNVPGGTSPIRSVPLGQRTFEELSAAGESLSVEARDLRSVSGLVGHGSLNPSTVQTVDLGLGRQSYDVVASPAAGVRMRPIDSPLVLGRMQAESTSLRPVQTSPGQLSSIDRRLNNELVRRPGDPLTPSGQPQDEADSTGDTDPPRLPGQPTDELPGQVPSQVPGQTPGQVPGQTPGDSPAAPGADDAPASDPFANGLGLLSSDRLTVVRGLIAGQNETDIGVGAGILTPEEAALLRGVPMVDQLVEPGEGIEADAAYVLHMVRGQELLTNGRFFDAEERFVTALSIRPDDPTAEIGRVHAQLGAGLLRSASTNLRSTLNTYPELVGVRYSEDLLPSAERLELMLRELGFAQDLPMSSVGLLRAYVGFQTNEQSLMLEGLDQLRSGTQSDFALARLLSEVWLADDKP